jgi:hypothetical protein
MSNDTQINHFYKGTFVGVFQTADKQSTGYFSIANLQCIYLRIEQCSPIYNLDIDSLKTHDYWFQKRLRDKKRLPWHSKTEIFIPFGEDKFYSGDLYNVLIKNLQFQYGGKNSVAPIIHQDWIEITGDIYFQIEPKRKKSPPPATNRSTTSTASGFNILPEGYQSGTNISGANTYHLPEKENVVIGGTFESSITNTSTIQASRPWLSGLGWLLRILAALAITYYLWQYSPVLGALLLGSLLLYGIGKFLWKNGIFKSVMNIILLLFLAYFLYSIIYRDGIKGTPVKTRTGNVTIDPPKRDDGNQQEGPDYTTSKQIDWYDFINRFYSARYKTSQTAFDNSVADQNELSNNISASRAGQFFAQYYEGLYRIDKDKIQQVASIFRDSARMKNMNQLEVAEMVITFIQEIPYYLIHDGNCQMAIANGNTFIRDYHLQKKPCLPNIKGGVQSPYEFLHNLKGDCDTRSLLGFAILTELKIPSSIWISEVYGHSILGVGLPVGHGIYKTIEGIKHYGVELTAKGFRLGMVAPENARPFNWDISIYKNQL